MLACTLMHHSSSVLCFANHVETPWVSYLSCALILFDPRIYSCHCDSCTSHYPPLVVILFWLPFYCKHEWECCLLLCMTGDSCRCTHDTGSCLKSHIYIGSHDILWLTGLQDDAILIHDLLWPILLAIFLHPDLYLQATRVNVHYFVKLFWLLLASKFFLSYVSLPVQLFLSQAFKNLARFWQKALLRCRLIFPIPFMEPHWRVLLCLARLPPLFFHEPFDQWRWYSKRGFSHGFPGCESKLIHWSIFSGWPVVT